MKSWLQDNDVKIYLTDIEKKNCRCRIKNKIKNKNLYKYLTASMKNLCIHKLPELMRKYNNISQRTIKVKPLDVKLNTHVDIPVEYNTKNLTLRSMIE